jgi:hypothetical protein
MQNLICEIESSCVVCSKYKAYQHTVDYFVFLEPTLQNHSSNNFIIKH